MAIIPRANPGNVQTDLVGIGARNEARVSYAGANAIGEATRAVQQGLGAVAQYAEKEAQKADISGFQESQRKLDAWEETTNDPNNPKGFYSYKGRDALGLKDALLPDFDKTASEIGAKLSPRAQEKFKEYADGRRHAIATSANSYATREYDGWRDANSKAWETGQRNNIGRAYQSGSEDEAVKLLGGALETMAAESIAEGRPMAELTNRQAAFTSDVHASILNGMLVSDPMKAREYFDTHKDELLPETRTTAEAKVQVYGDDAEMDQVVQEHGSGRVQVPMGSSDHSNVQTKLGALGDQHGFETTSTTRSKAENDKVGGVTNSQHLSGTARDYSVKGKSPAQVAAFASALKAEGFEVITRDHGTGPHVHAELPGNRKAVQRQPPATLGEYIESVRNDPRANTPLKKKTAETKARNDWQVREADKLGAKSASLERANLAIETADPATPLRQILGGDFEAMAMAGHVDSFERRLTERRTGVTVASNPNVVAAMEEGIYRARAGGEAAQAALRAMNPYDPTLQLAPDDRKRLGEAKLALLSGDAKQVAKAATEAEVGLVIRQYRTQQLGLTDEAVKKDPAKQAQAITFDQSMRAWRAEFSQANDREPTYLEVRKQADTLTLSALSFDVPGRVFGTNTESVADLQIPADMQPLIVEALQSEGVPITGQAVANKWRAYLRQQAK